MPSFVNLGISESRNHVLEELGFTEPTQIQAQAIPPLLNGNDVLGQAQTGTGKTAAFSLPLLESIDIQSKTLQALVLAPTRELALQVTQAMRSFNQKPSAKIVTVYGGQSIDRQISQLERGGQVVVGTPGRVIDLMDRGHLRLENIRFFVLDEADEMLNMGFIQDVEKILAATPADRQTAFFSATMPSQVKRLAKSYLIDPVMIKVEAEQRTPDRIEQQAYVVPRHLSKEEALLPILDLEAPHASIIFVRTKDSARRLTSMLQEYDYSVDEYHGNLTQVQRESLLRRFRNQQVKLVVATDIAARGLDIDSLTHVINLDIPDDLEKYVHRIGRTGRAGRTGKAIAILTSRERYKVRQLEKRTGQSIEVKQLPTMAELQANRLARFTEQIHAALSGERLASFLPLVSQLSEEYDNQAVAAAALQLAYSRVQSEKSEKGAIEVLSKEAKVERPVKRSGNSGKPVKRYGRNSYNDNGGKRSYDKRSSRRSSGRHEKSGEYVNSSPTRK
ncbi:DEAD/DEAH box helicase domain protein [Thalassoporum mexicanum PCC 7367]|uniref:DEAD/DEAH box helicase n=1 Tax=Thalassoporum mexicanum TaxID=3457544 RepID=UPI00029FEB23|nr:DEAD/DEAH box helicase [Pseudanabaena sp. PCC 7367]AFY71587.1 DEAD/DEAH box helicase domain protein [Pseudanabaena sp. PCC 7367]